MQRDRNKRQRGRERKIGRGREVSSNTAQDSWLSHFLLLWTPHLEFTPTRPYRHCSTLSSFKAKLKTFLFSQYFHPN